MEILIPGKALFMSTQLSVQWVRPFSHDQMTALRYHRISSTSKCIFGRNVFTTMAKDVKGLCVSYMVYPCHKCCSHSSTSTYLQLWYKTKKMCRFKQTIVQNHNTCCPFLLYTCYLYWSQVHFLQTSYTVHLINAGLMLCNISPIQH